MNSQSILIPLFQTIDRVLFGIVDHIEIKKNPDELHCENEAQFDASSSSVGQNQQIIELRLK